ncbi:hypothetical protein EEB14_55590 [Rhodococcus sp. WS4]|nr:hypothetical protein EEB14_55590 [Rhodococcus sp. WS4]
MHRGGRPVAVHRRRASTARGRSHCVSDFSPPHRAEQGRTPAARRMGRSQTGHNPGIAPIRRRLPEGRAPVSWSHPHRRGTLVLWRQCRRARVPGRRRGRRFFRRVPHVRPKTPRRVSLPRSGSRRSSTCCSTCRGARSKPPPIIANVDTGYASWRRILWARWPSAGPPPYFRSARHYDALLATMLDCGSILDPAMVYWDVRLSAHLPTIEIRISDVPATVHETVLLAVLVRALVTTALSALGRGDLARPVGDDLLRAACWRAAHDGLTGHGIDTAAQNLVPVARLLGLLLAHVRTALEGTGDYACTRAAVARVLDHGNGAVHQQRALHAGTLDDVIRTVADRTAEISARTRPLGGLASGRRPRTACGGRGTPRIGSDRVRRARVVRPPGGPCGRRLGFGALQ